MTQMLNVFQVMTDRVAFVEVAGVEMGKHALVSDLSSSFSLGEFGFFCQCSIILFQHLEHFYCWISWYYTLRALRVLHVISRQNLSSNTLITFSWFKVLLKQIAYF